MFSLPNIISTWQLGTNYDTVNLVQSLGVPCDCECNPKKNITQEKVKENTHTQTYAMQCSLDHGWFFNNYTAKITFGDVANMVRRFYP